MTNDMIVDGKVLLADEPSTECPYGYESCDQDDFESMCDGCRQDRGEAHSDAYNDTYD